MKNFEEFSKKYPDTAQALLEMTKEEILDHYALEVAEKDESEEFKNTYEDYHENLECIVNAAKWWMQKNEKENHYLYISTEKIELIQKETIVTKWI